MAKNMAIIEEHTVTTVIWCNDATRETDTMKDPKGRYVGIGDTYENGKWFRGGVEILTPYEEAQKQIAEMEEQLESAYTEENLLSAYKEGVNSV